ncbi:App1 family protein [Cutibacterium sp.]|uniref:App1 family protein n=1 Tax=Cutibacterium sp. TaxID=1912221 RepID=UPI0034C65D4D
MSNRPFIGARVEDAFHRCLSTALRRRGWKPRVIGYRSYGSATHVRVLGRVVLTSPPGTDVGNERHASHSPLTQRNMLSIDLLSQRGWRNFLGLPAPDTQVVVDVNGEKITVKADRAGYVDVRVKNHGLQPGWHDVTLSAAEDTTTAKVLVVSRNTRFGIVSDIDDTVIATSLPRSLIAAWNSFVRTEQARKSIPGMARMYQKLLERHPDAPVVYVSTGAWNTYPFLVRFLARHGYPQGPLLLTDWGPTNTGWFRSGVDHKRTALRELARDFPNIEWVLVGDDGQHDIRIYSEFDELQPGHTRAIAIRELSTTQQMLAHGTTTVLEDHHRVHWTPESAPLVRAPDGDQLAPLLDKVLNREHSSERP